MKILGVSSVGSTGLYASLRFMALIKIDNNLNPIKSYQPGTTYIINFQSTTVDSATAPLRTSSVTNSHFLQTFAGFGEDVVAVVEDIGE